MRTFFVISLLIVALTENSQVQMFSQTCSQGVIIRTNGSIIIDAWRTFDSSPPGPVKFPSTTGTPQPTSVQFGYTLPDNLKVCVEDKEADGSTCIELAAIRTLAASRKVK